MRVLEKGGADVSQMCKCTRCGQTLLKMGPHKDSAKCRRQQEERALGITVEKVKEACTRLQLGLDGQNISDALVPLFTQEHVDEFARFFDDHLGEGKFIRFQAGPRGDKFDENLRRWAGRLLKEAKTCIARNDVPDIDKLNAKCCMHMLQHVASLYEQAITVKQAPNFIKIMDTLTADKGNSANELRLYGHWGLAAAQLVIFPLFRADDHRAPQGDALVSAARSGPGISVDKELMRGHTKSALRIAVRKQHEEDSDEGSEAILTVNEMKVETRKLYPERPGLSAADRIANVVVPEEERLVITAENLSNAIARSNQEAKSGISAWLNPLLRRVFNDEDDNPHNATAMTHWAELATAYANGELLQCIYDDMLNTAKIVLIPKPNQPGRLRPIAMECNLIKIMTKAMALSVVDRLHFLAEVQSGVGVPDGVAKNVFLAFAHVLDEAVSNDETDLTLLDMTNGFGSIFKSAVFEGFQTYLPELSNWFRCSHSEPKRLFTAAGTEVGKCHSLFMGGSLSPLAFAVGVHKSLLEVQSLLRRDINDNERMILKAFLDDIMLLGNACKIDLDAVRGVLKAVGLDVNGAKTQVFTLRKATLSRDELDAHWSDLQEGPVGEDGTVKVLGSFVGKSQRAIKRKVQEVVKECTKELRALKQFEDPRHRLTVLRSCFPGKVVHLVRTTEPKLVDDAIDDYRHAMAKAYQEHVLELTPGQLELPRFSRKESIERMARKLELPTELGGLGFMSLNKTARRILYSDALSSAIAAFDNQEASTAKRLLTQLGESKGSYTVTRWSEDDDVDVPFECDDDGKATGVAKGDNPKFWYGNGKHPTRHQRLARSVVKVPFANIVMDGQVRRRMHGYIKIADRMVQITLEEQCVQDKPVLHAKALSFGVRNIGQKSVLRKTFLMNRSNNSEDPRLNIGKANYVALMRSYTGYPIRVTEREDPQATPSTFGCVHSSCRVPARDHDDHGLGCNSMAGPIKKRHNALRDAVLECATSDSEQCMVTATEREPRYRKTDVKSDGRLIRLTGDDIDFDVTVVHVPAQLDREKENLGEHLRHAQDPIQSALKTAATAKGRHYEQANEKRWKLLHPRPGPDETFEAIGGSDQGIALRVSDMVPLVFDSSGTPLKETADWLKKVIPASKWRKFEDLVSHITANYYGSILRSAPKKWSSRRSARRDRGERSHRTLARAHAVSSDAAGDAGGASDGTLGAASRASSVASGVEASA